MKQLNTLLVTLPSPAEMGQGRGLSPFRAFALSTPLGDLGVNKVLTIFVLLFVLSAKIFAQWPGSSAGQITYTANATISQNFTLTQNTTVTVNSGVTVTVNGVIGGAANITLTKAGAGTLTLNGVNSYQGVTIIDNGTLKLDASGKIETSSEVRFANNTNTKKFDISAGNKTVKGLSTLNTAAHTTSEVVGSFILTVDNTQNFTFAGVIDCHMLEKNGSGTLTLNGVNTYGGATRIENGTLALGASGSIANTLYIHFVDNANTKKLDISAGDKTVKAIYTTNPAAHTTSEIVLGSRTLTVNTITYDVTFAGVISGSGGITKTGAKPLTLNGVNTYQGVTIIENGTLVLDASGKIANSSEVRFANNSNIKKFDVSAEDKTVKGLSTLNTAAHTTSEVVVGFRTLTVDNTQNFTFAGVISGGSSAWVWKSGSGTLTLNGVNSYEGLTRIYGGTLALGSSGTIAESSEVQFADNSNIKKFDISAGNKTVKGLSTVNTSAHTTSEVVLGSMSLTVDNTKNFTFAGVISGNSSANFYKSGSGTLTLNGVNSYGGLTWIGNGTLTLGLSGTIANSSEVRFANNSNIKKFDVSAWMKTVKGLSTPFNTSAITTSEVVVGNSSLTVDNTQNFTFAGVISGNSLANFYKSGSGTLTLSGVNSYGGLTLIENGTLTLGATGTIANSSEVRFYDNANIKKFDISAGNKTVKGLSTLNTAAHTTSEIALGAGTLTVENSPNFTFAGVISGTGGITKTDAGTLTLNGANTYQGVTEIQNGTLSLGTYGTIANSSEVRFVDNANIKKFDISAASSITVKGLSTVNTAAHTTSEVVVGASTLYVDNIPNFTFAGVISGGTSAWVWKSGSGTLTLNGVNTYGGLTRIDNGTLTLGASGTIANSSNVRFSDNANTKKFDISAGDKTVKGLHTLNTAAHTTSEVVVGSRTLTVDNTQNFTFAGIISGTGGITKTGAETLILNGVNTYEGITLISNGTLTLDASGSIANSSEVKFANNSNIKKFDVSAGNKTIKGLSTENTSAHTTSEVAVGSRTLTVDNTQNFTFAGVISSSAYFYKSGSGTLTLNGVNSYTGVTLISNGTLSLGASGTIAESSEVRFVNNSNTKKFDISTGDKTVKGLSTVNTSAHTTSEVVLGNRTLTIDLTFNFIYAGIFSGLGGNVIITGTGSAFTMNGTNNLATGTFTAQEGTVNIGGNWNGNFLKGSASTLTVNGNVIINGTLTMQGGVTNMNLSGAAPSRLSATGAASATGTNTLNITSVGGANSYLIVNAVSGVEPYANFTLTGSGGTLSATDMQLTFTKSTEFVPVTDIIDLPTAATVSEPLELTGTVVPGNATNQTIIWSVYYEGATGATITDGNILHTTNPGLLQVKAIIENGFAIGEPFEKIFEITVIPSSIDELRITNYELRVYPNPTSGKIWISLPNPSEGGAFEAQIIKGVQIYDVTGRQAPLSPPEGGKSPLSFGVGSGERLLDLSQLPKGTYFIKIITDKGELTKIIIKE